MSFITREGRELLGGERIDWVEEYHERELAREEFFRSLEKQRKQEKQESDERFRTTYSEKYTLHKCPPLGTKIVKEDDVELYKRIRKEVEQHFAPIEYPVDYRSVTKIDFGGNELPKRAAPEPELCAMVREQPITFWTEHFDCVPGVTKPGIQSSSPFGKNASFTKPVDAYATGPVPGEMPEYPS
ncbi:unnamed protein product [Calicophoron daubneyi]|uniref:Uncharacterized protein n=1 Tax=Calicophoron daubneyi TaxID=300641 RepID=A0AAV2TNB2_CALDB